MLARTPSIVSWRPPRSPGQRRVSSTLTIPQPLTWSLWRTAYRLGSLRNIRTVFQRKYGIYLFRVKAKFSLNSANTGTGILPNTNFTFMRIFHEFQGIREIFRIGIGIVWVVELPRSSWKESALTRKSIFQCCEAAELFLLALASTLRIFGHLTANALLRDLNTVKILLRLHSKSLVLDPQHFFFSGHLRGQTH